MLGRKKRKWLHVICVLTGTHFWGKDGYEYGRNPD